MDKIKADMIERVKQDLITQGEQIHQDKVTPAGDRCLQMDIILDTMKFLDNYEENVAVLNKYYLEKREKERLRGEIYDDEKYVER